MTEFDYRVIYVDARNCGIDHEFLTIPAATEEEANQQVEAHISRMCKEHGHFEGNWRLL